jgi:hypothetical protein
MYENSIYLYILSSRSSIGWAELWRCLGYKFESYLGQTMGMLKLVYRLRLGRSGAKPYKFKSCYPYKGGYSSIGRIAVCGSVRSLFESGYPPVYILI